ncbi:MAG TPA: tetratricopeptide repeat protein [Dehalococcoidia bacterium]|jgi:tetratricopeptide (TPR) repeat protein
MVLRRSPASLSLTMAVLCALALSAVWWATGGPFAGKNAGSPSAPHATGNPAVSASGATDTAIANLQAQVQSHPNAAALYAALGDTYLQKARETADPSWYTKADTVFGQALSLDANDFDALVGQGSLALSRHQFQQALDLGQRAQTLNPANPDVYGVIGDAQIELGQYEAAVQTFQKMVDLRPDLQSYSRVSYARELYGEDDAALQAMIKAADEGAPGAEGTAWTMVQVGNLYFNRGDLDDAEHWYQLSIFNFNGYPHGYAGLANVLAARGKDGEGIALYQKVTKVLPLPQYVIALGDLQQRAGRSGDAGRTYQLAVAEEQLYTAAGVDADLELAQFDADHGRNLDGVLAQAQAAQQRRPSVKGDDVLAWVQFKTGDVQGAWATAQRALRLGTNDPVMLYHAGAIAYAAGDRATARKYLERVAVLNPHFSPLYEQDAARLLQELRAQPDAQPATEAGHGA